MLRQPAAPLWELPLMEFIPRVSRAFTSPYHLEPFVDELDAAIGGGVQCCVSTPPRHVKTTTAIHKIVSLIASMPGTFLGYATYNQQQARDVSRKARVIARACGLEFEVDTLDQWVLKNGSRVTWGGVGASWTGKGFHVILCDDLIRNRKDAESPVIRETAWEWFNGTIFTRQEPGEENLSIIVIGTRWHHDDPIGRLIKMGWRFVNLQAISVGPDGVERALWPDGFSLERLREIEAQVGPYEFAALFQGEPRHKGATVFGEPSYYDALPSGPFRVSGGFDFAYSANTWSDWSVLVILRAYADAFYVVDVLRARCDAPRFKMAALPVVKRHGLNKSPTNPGLRCYVGGQEKGVTDLLKMRDDSDPTNPVEPLHVEAVPAGSAGDKFARAQPAASAWNPPPSKPPGTPGRVLLPATIAALGPLGEHYIAQGLKPSDPPPWVAPYRDVMVSFTGVKDPVDDDVDATASAFIPFIAAPAPPPPRGVITSFRRAA
jgi:hypothetical protein